MIDKLRLIGYTLHFGYWVDFFSWHYFHSVGPYACPANK